jgi:hypothetical protein
VPILPILITYFIKVIEVIVIADSTIVVFIIKVVVIIKVLQITIMAAIQSNLQEFIN